VAALGNKAAVDRVDAPSFPGSGSKVVAAKGFEEDES
jgi:hypothetical protein